MFVECDKVSGDDGFIARLHLRSMAQVDTLLDRLNHYAETNFATRNLRWSVYCAATAACGASTSLATHSAVLNGLRISRC